jgi:hypothetical protein
MKIKKEYIILVALIVALSLYLILRNPDRAHYRLPELPHFSAEDISSIEISKADKAFTLNKKDEQWYIAPKEYPADTNKIKSMTDVIEKLTLTALVSESENYERYDLTDDKKITVKAWTGDTLRREFEVGKAATTFRHTFVKLGGDHRVYHAQKYFRDTFDQTVDNLRDKNVLSFDKAEIAEIHITKADQSMVLQRREIPVEVSASEEMDSQTESATKGEPEIETVWQNADGEKVNPSKISNILSTLSNLHCTKYVDDSKKEDFKDPIYNIQLKGAQEYTLSIFEKIDENDSNYPALSSDNDYPFFLSQAQADNIMNSPEELVEEVKDSRDGGTGE